MSSIADSEQTEFVTALLYSMLMTKEKPNKPKQQKEKNLKDKVQKEKLKTTLKDEASCTGNYFLFFIKEVEIFKQCLSQ